MLVGASFICIGHYVTEKMKGGEIQYFIVKGKMINFQFCSVHSSKKKDATHCSMFQKHIIRAHWFVYFLYVS